MFRTATMAAALAAFIACSTVVYAHGDQGPRIPLPDEHAGTPTPLIPQSASGLAKAALPAMRFATANPTWRFRMNDRTSTPHRAWGRGIQIDGFQTLSLLSAPQAGRSFIDAHADVLGARPDQLRLLYSEIAGGRVYQKYIQRHEGLDVLNTYVDLRMTVDGRVTMFGSDAYPSVSVSTTPALSHQSARAFATAGLDGDPSLFEYEDGNLAILPLNYPDRTEFRLVRNVVVTVDINHVWDTYVDAHSGAVVWRKNLSCQFHDGNGGPNGVTTVINGRVTMSVYTESWLLGATTVPVPNIYVHVGSTTAVTDADGRFSVDIGALSTAPVVARLSGPYAIARRADTTTTGTIRNALQLLSATAGQDVNIHWDDVNSAASERSVFYHITRVRNWIRGLDPSTTMVNIDAQMQGIVNIADECNANWNGRTVNFFAQSASCGNTAEIADVVYHEYGHALNTFIYRRLKNTSMRNGALSEGTADINANLLRDDPRIGIGFQKGQANQGIIRNSDNSLRYPENIVNQIHTDGMIIAGAVWDVRKNIGLERTSHLAHFAKYGTPDAAATGEAFADYFLEFLIADDDDGDLSNGTPNSDGIVPAFIKHGIPSSGIILAHTPMSDQPAGTTPYTLTGSASVGSSINLALLKVNELRVHYTTDNWQTSSSFNAVMNGASFTGEFPAQQAGTIVRYYLEAVDNFGSMARMPVNAPSADYLFLVGFESKFFHDAEAVDGYSVLSDATTGAWIRAVPVGTWNTALGAPPDVPYVQPNEDHTPGAGKTRCWVTGNAAAGAGLGEADVDDGSTYLTSPNYDISAMRNPVLRYFRWYSNDAGATPGTDNWIVKISSDGGTSWVTIEDTKASDASWRPIVIRLREKVDLTTTFKVMFEASDLGEGSLVEAAVDDIEILDAPEAVASAGDGHRSIDFSLEQNYPNPFNPSTTIRYTLPRRGDAKVSVYSPAGRLIAVVASGMHEAGAHQLSFDAAGLTSGVYTYVLEAGSLRSVRRMMVLK